MANAVLARQPQFSKFEYWSSNLNFLIENLKIAELHPQKSAFYHESFFTIRLQINPFLELTSGIDVTFYALFEYLGDFD